MVSTANLCIVCKGARRLCGLKRCPLLAKQRIAPIVASKLKEEYFGPSTSIFVGRNFYPNVLVGPMQVVSPEDLSEEDLYARGLSKEGIADIDVSNKWFGKSYEEIIELRSFSLRSKYTQNVHSRERFVDQMQELALAAKPTDIEAYFKKKPVYNLSFSDMVQPMGPSASLKLMRITENPKMPLAIEKVVSDELKAVDAATILYSKGQDVYKITTVLSSGALGLEPAKKLVPTRWSITAVDDMIGKQLIEMVKQYPSVNDYLVFESNYLDNHFVILLAPGSWQFENFEAWAPGSTWAQQAKETQIIPEYESYAGRTRYAIQGGGYYSARLAVVEYLASVRRQASVVSFREVSEGYVIPVGVFVVRETARNAFNNPPRRFPTKEAALKHIESRLRLPINEYISKSQILKQRRLSDFFL